MVWKDRVYFSSDRDGTMNLWGMDPDGGNLTQLTRHRGFDVLSPALSNGRIVYQLGADLHVHDIGQRTTRRIPITLPSDFEQTREKWIEKPLKLASRSHTHINDGGTPVWLIEGEPGLARVYRTLHLAASRAAERIWITDAYFVAPRALSEALAAAAQQGVDVRILVPAYNNWPIVGSMSRGGYRYLLTSGVRIFEWQGPMMHAKTSVVDGCFCRVGSSNLNAASLMGNWELDVGVLDADLGRQLERLFMTDLASSVEIVLPGRSTIGPRLVSSKVGISTESLDPEGSFQQRVEQRLKSLGHSPGRLTLASVVRAGESLGGALAGDGPLGREDRTVLGTVSLAILLLSIIAAAFPAFVGWVVAIVAGWLGLTTGTRAFLQARGARMDEGLEGSNRSPENEVGKAQ